MKASHTLNRFPLLAVVVFFLQAVSIQPSYAGPLTNAQKIECGARASTLAPEALPWVVPSYLNGNPRCDPSACKGGMSKADCIKAALSFIACAHWEWDFSACLSQELGQGYLPDPAHMKKIREDYEEGLRKCPAKCLSKFGLDPATIRQSYYGRQAASMANAMKGKAARAGASKFGSKACCMLGKVGAKSLVKVLGPIGVAYTVGEVGAAAIGAGSDFYVATLEKNFACGKIPSLNTLVTTNCNKASNARQAFSNYTGGCGISFEPAYDGCGPIGLKQFNPSGAACEKDRSCDDESFVDNAADKFSTAAENTTSCLSSVRLRSEYQRICDGKPACVPGQP